MYLQWTWMICLSVLASPLVTADWCASRIVPTTPCTAQWGATMVTVVRLMKPTAVGFISLTTVNGYEHAARPNDYESIGPDTAYQWSFQRTVAVPTMRNRTCVGTSDINTLISSVFHFTRMAYSKNVAWPHSVLKNWHSLYFPRYCCVCVTYWVIAKSTVNDRFVIYVVSLMSSNISY